MVEQMVSSNLSKYGLGKCPNIVTTTSTADSQAVSLVDTTDEPNDNKHLKSTEDSSLQKEDAVTQAKDPLPGASIINVNRNLVYARRRSDVDMSNSRTSEKNRTTAGYQQAEQQLELTPQKENESFANIPVTSITTGTKSFENEQSAMVNMPAMDHWNARFSKLNKYVQQCDSANQEVYLQKLRSFSPDECGRHAVVLERRAIQLTVEEGTELKRVKDLNILGNSAGNHLLLRALNPVFKSENMV